MSHVSNTHTLVDHIDLVWCMPVVSGLMSFSGIICRETRLIMFIELYYKSVYAFRKMGVMLTHFDTFGATQCALIRW